MIPVDQNIARSLYVATYPGFFTKQGESRLTH